MAATLAAAALGIATALAAAGAHATFQPCLIITLCSHIWSSILSAPLGAQAPSGSCWHFQAMAIWKSCDARQSGCPRFWMSICVLSLRSNNFDEVTADIGCHCIEAIAT